MISEYLKTLGERDVHTLRMLLNEMHKGGSKKELKNYRPMAIINVMCKLFMKVSREIRKE